MVAYVSAPPDGEFEFPGLAELVNRDMLPVDAFEEPHAPASQEVEAVIGSMKKFVERLN